MFTRLKQRAGGAAIVGAVMVISAIPAAAQYGPRYDGPRYDGQRDGYSGRSAGREYREGLFDRVQQDLDRAAGAPISNGTRGRIDHARKQVWQFQRQWAAGRFDKGDLDDAIGSVQHVVDSSSVDYRSRQALADDLSRMREFRAQRGYRGYR